MKFIADLHIHSKFSRATAKNLDLEHIYMAAMTKGVRVVGTGDFTYPEWIDEIEQKLKPAEDGLFKLKPELGRELDKEIPELCRNKVRFILQTEISSIYKKNDRVRKNHNLIFFPTIDSVKKFNLRLDKIGNIRSDGRPILGLAAENLLELMLETDDNGFFIPAHIWTPWFSMFGSKSGFDSIEECFGTLSKYIFAAETGLSSDLPMNWRVKNLDGLNFVSNSDAHSPRFLGRNASVFNTDLSYFAIRDALEQRDHKYTGTIDMYPEQGKYHYDGHRKCNVCLNPVQSIEMNGICPECGRPMTLGVLHRVQDLAGRPEGFVPENRHGYQNIIPLCDILSEIFQVGPNTKKVTRNYNRAIEIIGPELEILLDKDIKEIEKTNIPLLARAVEKMRQGDVKTFPGFDGEFGKVRIFDAHEMEKLKGDNLTLFGGAPVKKKKKKKTESPGILPETNDKKQKQSNKKEKKKRQGLNNEQKKIVLAKGFPLIVEAGPGTGKTRTLTEKIARLITCDGVSPDSILALTFTTRAAKEMEQRLALLVENKKQKSKNVCTTTFHAFCLMILKEFTSFKFEIADNDVRESLIKAACKDTRIKPSRADLWIQKIKQSQAGPEIPEKNGNKDLINIFKKYEELLTKNNLVDFEDLITLGIEFFQGNGESAIKIKKRFTHIFVDEYQDINKGQYILVKNLAQKGENLMVIGDPDQSIYGFRGSDNKYFNRFIHDFPGSRKITLTENFRSTQTILDASFQLITDQDRPSSKTRIFSNQEGGRQKIIIMETASDKAEAVAIGKMIESLMGGVSSLSSARQTDYNEKEYSFADFAVLFRTRKQSKVFEEIFEKANLPFQSVNTEKKKPKEEKNSHELIIDDQDLLAIKAEKISLLTMHASKGLEFPVVFVAGCEEDYIPFSKSFDNIEDIEEERRLFYVAMTRARDILCLTHAEKRVIFGRPAQRKKSRFLASIQEELKQYQKSNLQKKKRPALYKQLELF